MYRTLALLLPAALLAVSSTDTAGQERPRTHRQLAVSSNHLGTWQIFLVSPDSGEARNLTKNKANNTDPTWAPDGKHLAFVSDLTGTPEIWVMKVDGGGLRQLTRKSGGIMGISWSPDGAFIAFTSGRRGTDHIYLADSRTGRINHLTDGKAPCRWPAWSPDGKRLTYSYYGDEGRYATHIINVDGTGKRDLAGEDGGLDSSWSPTGKKITFTSLGNRDDGFRVYTIDPDGKNRKELTTVNNTVGNVFPRFSPDGTKVAYGELVDGKIQVAVVGADGAGARVLTSKASHLGPRWSPDGRSLAFARVRDKRPPALVVCDADGKNQREVIRGYGSGEWRPR